jgi:hypothetical protein
MNTGLWVLPYLASAAFSWWVVWGGGASWLEGWRAPFFLEWLLSYTWSSEQIALYTLICWVGHTVWFLVGLFEPMARFASLLV